MNSPVLGHAGLRAPSRPFPMAGTNFRLNSLNLHGGRDILGPLDSRAVARNDRG